MDSPYERFENKDLILRDELAIDRTRLANERTLMAYLRSAVAMLIAGVSILHFSGRVWFTAVGIACLPGAVAAGIVGVVRYRNMEREIAKARNREGGGGSRVQGAGSMNAGFPGDRGQPPDG
ncbi:MAG: DUF202 domain-containing protein [Planctomycetota bacterium]